MTPWQVHICATCIFTTSFTQPAPNSQTLKTLTQPSVDHTVVMSEVQGSLTVCVRLPDAESMAALELSMSSGGESRSPGKLSLEVKGRSAPVLIEFPAPAAGGIWDTEAAVAKFSKRRRELTVTLRGLL